MAEDGKDKSTRLAEDRTDLAEDRTDWAEDRTVLANERTFASWMRTGLASAALGLGFNALVRSFDPPWLAKSGATLFLLIGIGIFYIAQDNACTVGKRLGTHGVEKMSGSRMRLIASALSLACFVIIVIIWLIEAKPGA